MISAVRDLSGRRVLTFGDEMLCVELENGVWLAEGEGDPPRTLDPDNARLFWPREKAEDALKDARRFRPFESAKIYLAIDPETLYA